MNSFQTAAQAAQWLRDRHVTDLQTDSRKLRAGEAFVAWPGAAVDGRHFVASALQASAAGALVEAQGVSEFHFSGDAVASVQGLKAMAGPIAAKFYGHPSEALSLVAVTGTNGKTSTAWWLSQALSMLPGDAALPCGLIGTLGVGQPPLPGDAQESRIGLVSTGMTTPDPVLLQKTLRSFVDAGLKACAMEASSIGIAERRLDAARVRVAVFTNFTQDHLDYHGSMDAYWAAKRELFAWPGLEHAVVNVDDVRGAELAHALQGSALKVWTVSTKATASVQAHNIQHQANGLNFDVVEGAESYALQTRMIGSYNVSNLLGVVAAMRALGVSLQQAVVACEALLPVPGRMECLGGENKPLVAVDYAHTPDALEQALIALRPLAQARGGKLWCVFGCGGDRDAAKRPLMGAIAARSADRVVVTSDNPRSEKPEAILSQILLGLVQHKDVDVEVDRAQAIADAVAQAAPADVILLAGKGHEDTQEIAGIKHPFSDRSHAQRALDAKKVQSQTSMATLAKVLPWMAQAALHGDGAVTFNRVHTDTRTVEPGDLFVALRGERYDANDFLLEAQQRGAAAVVCTAGLSADRYPAGLPRIEVPDTKVALGQLAAAWRQQFDIPVIAVTGSNGKTTVTQMVASILRVYAPQDTSLATRGNFNNDIGVPLTLLRMRAHHRIAVVELGMNHVGEIATLAAMAAPTVALVNNAQREHLEFMQTVEAVAHENGSVLAALPAHGVAVYPMDDAYSGVWTEIAGARRQVQFALAGRASSDTLHCDSVVWHNGAWVVAASGMGATLHFRLGIAGRHNVKNALAAAACALAAGVPAAAVALGLEAFEPVKGRSRALVVQNGDRTLTLVDDSYNANPDSVRAAIDVLADLPAPRLLVLGDMGEVGSQGAEFHAEAGTHAAASGIEHVFALGELARHAVLQVPGAQHFGSVDVLNEAVLAELPRVSSVLVKGSRFMRMERVVEAVVAHAEKHKESVHG